jgi:serine/threonine protein kinase
MGEVYRARDTRLDRLVAVKVLPARIATDPNARARFEREARAIAALNHPNICAVHDVGHDGGHDFLVMELLEGETLHERLAKGALPITELVELGIALADALDAAHSRGVIHRDLKPANIFLTSRGQPKILDFGVAKVVSGSGDTTREASADLTGPGAAAGTIAYMSPEQLRGEALDARSDLFSLGLVLYEMATGRRAFDGRSSADISAAILAKQPEPPRQLRPDLPPKLEDAILKTLDKDRELRCQTAAELRADLRRLKAAGLVESLVPIASGPPPASAPVPPISSDAQIVVGVLKRHRLGALVIGLSVIVAVAAVGWVTRKAAASNSVGSASFPNLEIQPVTTDSQARNPTISPDGRFVAYSRRSRSIVVRQIGTEHEVEIVPEVPNRVLKGVSFTPDGSAIDFVALEATRQSLWRVPFLGGAPRQIETDVWSGVGWSPDGQKVAFVRTSDFAMSVTSVVIADADGTHERALATRHDPLGFLNNSLQGAPTFAPSWSLDGSTITVAGYSNDPARLENASEFVTIDAATGREVRAVPVRRTLEAVLWLSPTQFLVAAADNGAGASLWAVNPAGTAWTSITKDFAWFQNPSLTADRRTAVAQRTELQTGVWVADGAGDNPVNVAPEHAWGPNAPKIDNEGNTFFAVSLNSDFGAIYRLAAGDRNPRLVVPQSSQDFSVTPDGRFVVYTEADPPYGLSRVNADGTGLVRLVNRNATGSTITPDGQTVLYSPAYSKGLFSLPIDGGTPRKVTDQLVAGYSFVSPDAKRIIFSNGKPRTFSICDLPDCSNSRDITLVNRPWGNVTWTPDGRGIAFVCLDKPANRNIWVHPLDGGEESLSPTISQRDAFSISRGRRTVSTSPSHEACGRMTSSCSEGCDENGPAHRRGSYEVLWRCNAGANVIPRRCRRLSVSTVAGPRNQCCRRPPRPLTPSPECLHATGRC